MYDDNQVNNNIPRFDSQTGEPLFPQDNMSTDSNGTEAVTVQPAETQKEMVPDSAVSDGSGSIYTYYDPTPSQQSQKSAKELRREEKAVRREAKRSADGSKKSGAGYVVKLAVSAILFGLIAGSVMFGVNKLGERLDGKDNASDVDIPFVSTLGGNDSEGSGQTVKPSSIDTENTMLINQFDIKGIIKSNMPSIVAINGTVQSSYGYAYPFGGSQVSKTSGTGIIVGKNDTELLIVTNAHVVDGVSDLTCTFIDEEQVGATIKGSKSNKDIAVIAVPLSKLKSSTASSIAIAELGDSDSVELGDQVIAIGNAMGEGQSVTVGYISALNRTIVIDGTEYRDLMRTDAAINPGNSGGALINSSGKVIGINTAKYEAEAVEGMGYAIPISSIKDILDTLMNREARDKVPSDRSSYLGISGIDVTYSISQLYGYPRGVILQIVKEDSPAAKAGLVKNDILVSFDGDSVTSLRDLQETMQYYAAGEKVVIEYYHMEDGEYKYKSAEVTLGHNG